MSRSWLSLGGIVPQDVSQAVKLGNVCQILRYAMFGNWRQQQLVIHGYTNVDRNFQSHRYGQYYWCRYD